MTGVLTPSQALDYLLELSPSATAARVLDGAGITLAAHGAEPDRAHQSAGPPSDAAGSRVVHVSDARSDRELIVTLGPGAVAELVRVDAVATLAAVR